MEDKHTPGPWIVVEYDGRGPMEVQSSENPGASLALVYAENPEIELQANADLIASAPTLLEENRKLKEEARVLREALEVIPGFKLRALAMWLDNQYNDEGDVQADLRFMAEKSDAALSTVLPKTNEEKI